MSQENLESLERAIDAFNRRDLNALLAGADPEIVFTPRLAVVEGASYHGHDGIRKALETQMSTFPDWKLEVLEVRSHGDLTIATARGHGHGAGSDIHIEDMAWWVQKWRDGKCLSWQTYSSEAEALEAAGQSE
jgi:ketosteroid isomerase-like protein